MNDTVQQRLLDTVITDPSATDPDEEREKALNVPCSIHFQVLIFIADSSGAALLD